MAPKRIIIGISGATGVIYGIELLKALKAAGVETHLVITKNGQIAIAHETDYTVADVQKLAGHFYSNSDLSASISSGSFKTDGMIIAPCTMRSLAEIATANTSGLLTRAADVCLKERRTLVVMPRETPMHGVHIKNMLTVSELGGVICPPVPAFYTRPQTLDDIVSHTIGRVLDIFGIETLLVKRWEGVS
jgi:flavin prenyltransferase